MRPSAEDRGRRLDAMVGREMTQARPLIRGGNLLPRALSAFPGAVPVVSAAIFSVLVITGCGGGSTTTVEGAGVAGEAGTHRCEVTAVDGAIHDIEIGLSTTKELLDRALEGKKTVIVTGGPAGTAHIRGRSKSIFEAIHRELKEIRRTLRSC